MITTNLLGKRVKADCIGDTSLGNALFRIASTIGIATHNGFEYGFPSWLQQEFFVNKLPGTKGHSFKDYRIPPNFNSIDFGFRGWDVPDNRALCGELGAWKYFEHCEELIRYYFEMKPICEPYKDCILMHYRDYRHTGAITTAWEDLGYDYYSKALKKLPKKPVIVVTDNIDNAYKSIKIKCDYTSNSPIIDFYLLAHADYMVMANSTFSAWGAWLSQAMTVAPVKWFCERYVGAPIQDIYYKNWKRV
jgi:hypothetical protein